MMKAFGAYCQRPVSAADCLVEFRAPLPETGPRDLRVRVRAFAVNPVDTKIRASLGAEPLPAPRILGWDASGVVEAVGSEVRGFSPGDEVFYSGDLGRPGCNAEYHAVDERLVALKPADWSFADAAALPLVTLTAWELLHERMSVPRAGNDGAAILIINGAGGVGSALIPLAKRAGLRVVASASRPESAAWCRSLGADEIVSHRTSLIDQCAELGTPEFPWIANLYSPETHWQATGELLAPFGTLGLIVEPREKLHLGDPLKAKCARIAWEFMGARASRRSADMAEQGRILAETASLCEHGEFPRLMTRDCGAADAEGLRAAHAAMEEARAHGKWVFHI